jgi:adenylate cyclase
MVRRSGTMPAKLRVQSKSDDWELDCGELLSIGRDKTSDLSLPDLKVSRNHAIIRHLGDGRYYLIDAGSSNGTYVNNQRLLVPRVLEDADRITLGDHVLTFRQAPGTDTAGGDDMAEDDAATLLVSQNMVQEVTILVADVRDFTPLSEQMDVSALATLMARWFRTAGEHVVQNGGVVDKLLGDAIMARWLTGRQQKAQTVASALRCAHELVRSARQINEQEDELPFPFRIGIGLNSGKAVLGTVGGTGRDYTTMGDSVNLAFRLEKATKALRKDIVLGEQTFMHLPDAAWENSLATAEVKGKSDPLTICALTAEEAEGILLGLSLPVKQ